jgi:hypothetical protein
MLGVPKLIVKTAAATDAVATAGYVILCVVAAVLFVHVRHPAHRDRDL